MRKEVLGGIAAIVLLLAFGATVVMVMFQKKDDEISKVEVDIQSNLDANCDRIYPFYASLDQDCRDYYVKLCAGFEQHLDEVEIVKSESKSEINKASEWIDKNYRKIAYEQPDYFWVNPNSFTIKEISQNNKYILSIQINYTVSKEDVQSKKKTYDSTVKQIADEAAATGYTFDAILHVYNSILEKTDYDHELAKSTETGLIGYSAYGCLVEGKTVCSGYTLAFTSIMQKLGITCGAEFDANAENKDADTSHVWNYCKLDDGNYYYFDLTWDDTGFDSDELRTYLDYTHDFFAITAKELSYTHENLSSEPIAPVCTAETYNYYRQNSIFCEDYSFSAFKQAVNNQPQDNFVVVKFGSATERARAERDLFQNSQIYKIFPDVKGFKYIQGSSGLQLYIFFVS